MKIESGKVYVNAIGAKVKILCVDAPGEQPIIGVDLSDGDAEKYNADGHYYPKGRDCGLDLVSEYVEPPKPRECWVFSGEDAFGAAYTHNQRAELLLAYPSHAANLVLFREVIE